MIHDLVYLLLHRKSIYYFFFFFFVKDTEKVYTLYMVIIFPTNRTLLKR
ncbi:unnamed protein product [Arabidopsis halleri]